MIVFFQARNIETGALAAVKIIKLEPGKTHLPAVSLYTWILLEKISGGQWHIFCLRITLTAKI